MKKYNAYEKVKEQINNKNLSPEEYEKVIREMTKKLKI